MINLKITTVIACCLVIGVFSSCTQKKNPVGEESGLPLKEIILKEPFPFEYCYSYEDSVTCSMPNDKLIVGKSRKNRSIVLIRFGNLPDSDSEITSDGKLTIGFRGSYNGSEMSLSLGLVKQSWVQNEVTWIKAADESDWEDSWHSLNNIEIIDCESTHNDSIATFTLNKETMSDIIAGWTKDEPESYGFALFSEDYSDNQYIEFYTKDYDNGPTLSFNYRENDNEEKEYSRKAMYNSFINSASTLTIKEDLIAVGNLPPTKSVLKFMIDDSIFNVGSEELTKITINKAEIILFPVQDSCHFEPQREGSVTVSNITVIPYHIAKVLENPLTPIADEELVFLEKSIVSTMLATSDSLSFNITSILQAYISGKQENNGIVISSTMNNKDNTYVQFHGSDDKGKEPYIKIVYTESPW